MRPHLAAGPNGVPRAAIIRPAPLEHPQTHRIDFWTLKNRLGLERHQPRTLLGLWARIASKLVALAAGVWLNWTIGQPTLAFAAITT